MSGTLTIRRLRAECRLAGPTAGGARFREHTARSLQRDFAAAVRTTCGRWFDREDASVWVVRRLDLALLVSSEAGGDSLAASFADSLGRTLETTLIGDGDGQNAIRFESQTAYLRQFLLDTAGGDVANRWCYAPYSGLTALSASAAIRTAVLANPSRGHAALSGLDDRELAAVCAAVTALDEKLVLDGFAGMNGHGQEAPNDAVRTARGDHERAWSAASEDRLSHRAARAHGASRPGELFAAIRGVVPWEPPVPTDAGTESTDNAPVVIRAGTAPKTTDAWNQPRPAWTRFGGLFLLLSALEELPWDDWTEGWPKPPDTSASVGLKWITAALCSGRAQAQSVMRDPVIGAIFGISGSFEAREVGRWLRRVGLERQRALRRMIAARPGTASRDRGARGWFGMRAGSGIAESWVATLAPVARGVLRAFAARLPGFAASTPAHLWRNLLAFDASVESEPGRIVVRCGQPPLHLLLSITGMVRGTRLGTDATGRPIFAFPRE